MNEFIIRPSSNKKRYRSFKQAKIFVKKLKLHSKASWLTYIKGNIKDLPKLPIDIPKNPHQTYKGEGWQGYGDFLGTGNKAIFDKEYRVFNEARKFARRLNKNKTYMSGKNDWLNYVKISKKTKSKLIQNGEFKKLPKLPIDIPVNPEKFYKNEGWQNYRHFLSYDRSKSPDKIWKSYKQAKAFAKKLKLKNQYDWKKYIYGELKKLPKRPIDIPKAVYSVYRDKGWLGWGDFLGNKNTAHFKKEFLSYKEAKTYIKKASVKSQRKFKLWTRGKLKSSKLKFLPDKIPCQPERTYKNKGWISWGDFLGTKNIQPQKTKILKLNLAIPIAQKISKKYKIKNQVDWFSFFKKSKNKKILDKYKIPVSPYIVYGKSFIKKGGFNKWIGKAS